MIPIRLEKAGATWWHSDDYASPNLTKASLGLFFNEVLSEGAHIGEIWVFQKDHPRSAVYVSVYMTEDMKNNIESRTKFKFRTPPEVQLN